MDIIQQMCLALGLAGLAGVNLYLTTALVGVAVQTNMLSLAEKYEALSAIGHPAVIMTATVLFFLEFFADKIPWVDSVWDTIHTIIRPAGAVLMGITVLGDVDPALQVIGALCAGGIGLTTHATKMGTRLLANTTPEPISNMALSVTEDVGVVGGFFMLLLMPVIAFVVLAILLFGILFLLYRLYQRVRALRDSRRPKAEPLSA